MRFLAVGVALCVGIVSTTPAAASEWVDPSLEPGPVVCCQAAEFKPGSVWDLWFTHAELAWLQRHGLTLSAAVVLSERRSPPPPGPQSAGVRSPPPPRSAAPASVEAWRPLVAAYFAPGDVERALRIMACESGGDPSAKNPRSSASGLFQHLATYWPERSAAAGWAGASIWDPEANVAVAAWLAYHGGGWGHWVCR